MKIFTRFLFILSIFFLLGCGSNDIGENSTPPNAANIKSNSFVYASNSVYKNVLIDCVNPNNTESDSCSLNILPFIAQENQSITKEMIMQRLVVSHTWMAERFSQLLDRYNGKNMKNLFGAVTAIVIHKDVRPSFYTPVTGTIYLDPRYLWLTPEEASTITVQEDFRSDFGNDLQFITGSISTLNGDFINSFKALDSGLSRTIDEITLPFAELLYHELAHANDFIPPSIILNIDKSQSVFNATKLLINNRISVQLNNEFPLTSNKLASLGKVLYRGHTASDEEKELTGFVAGELFDEDRASDIYAYSSIYEDTATLFSNTMMKIHFNVDNNVLFLHTDTREREWGISNPIAKVSVKPRALFVSNKLSPIANQWDNKFNTLVGSFSYLHTRQNSKIFKSLQNNLNTIDYFKNLPL